MYTKKKHHTCKYTFIQQDIKGPIQNEDSTTCRENAIIPFLLLTLGPYHYKDLAFWWRDGLKNRLGMSSVVSVCLCERVLF